MMPNTKNATLRPMSAAPGQSTGGASPSRDSATVNVNANNKNPAAATTQKIDFHSHT